MKRLTLFICTVFVSILIGAQSVNAESNPALIIFEGIEIGMSLNEVE